MLIDELRTKGLIHPPTFLPNGVCLLVQMGSEAYGCSSNDSDVDLYGVCIPPKDDVFPHLRGEIRGFGEQHKPFEVWQKHHVLDKDNQVSYDLVVYSITRFVQLCMDSNPNMIDALFVPQRCVRYCSAIGGILRDNRKLFLSKRCWPKFRGYAFSQLHKMGGTHRGGKRKQLVEEFGFDVKFGYHAVRLACEVRQLLMTHDLCLDQDRELLKSIRRGEWTEQRVRDFFEQQSPLLEEAYHNSTLPDNPDEGAIRAVLLRCLEEHYGSLQGVVETERDALLALKQIQSVIENSAHILG